MAKVEWKTAFRTRAKVISSTLSRSSVWCSTQAERLRLDAATENSRAKSAMNKDRVALYAAQSEGLRVAVAEYHERVAAAEVELKKGAQELERYAQQINAGRLGIEAKALEWDGYSESIGCTTSYSVGG